MGVDFHPEFQRIASVDTDTGEFQEKRLFPYPPTFPLETPPLALLDTECPQAENNSHADRRSFRSV